MKTHSLFLSVVAGALVLTGCTSPYDGSPDRTGTGALTGGAIGAGAGAAIGSASGHAGEGALIGAAIGLISGGLIGHDMDQQEQARLKAQAPVTYQRVEQGQPLSIADVKALAKAGISEDIIISQLRVSRSIYHLSTADIIDLRDAGVSNKVIDYMINTATSSGVSQPAPAQQVVYVQQTPPPPRVETVVVSPGPTYVWVGGEWLWNGGWSWRAGYWCLPPYPNSIWIGGSWSHHDRGWRHSPGHWRPR